MVNGPRPAGRVGHAVTMVGSKLFVFGGKTKGETYDEYLNDTWIFDWNSRTIAHRYFKPF